MNVRELTRDEIAKIPKVITPIPESMFAMGVTNDDGEVVASVPVFLSIHAGPLWIREDCRKHPRILLRLWEATKARLQEYGGKEMFVGFTPEEPGPPLDKVLLKIYEAIGGKEFAARYFIIPVDSERIHA